MEQLQQEKQPTYNRIEVENTPFSIYEETTESGEIAKAVICIGNERASELDFKDRNEAIGYINQKEWSLICNTAFIVSVKAMEYEKTKEQQK